MNRTFILGIGAQKAGTSWLTAYLKHFSNVDLGIAKEYHIWNAIYNPLGLYYQFMLDYRSYQHKTVDLVTLLRFNMQTIPSMYEKYFDHLITGSVNITGDITPDYCALNATQFLEIKEKLEKFDFNVKVVFLIRDPVHRCWSNARNLLKDKGMVRSHDDAHTFFKNFYASSLFKVRTTYEKTISQIENVFPKENAYIGLYEEMFTDQNIKKLSDFCGVGYMPAYKNVVINAGEKVELNSKIAKQCYDFYKPTYDYFYDKMPQTKHLWSQF